MWNLIHEEEQGDPLNSQGKDDELDGFFSLLEGGKYGELHQNLIDYFYYCQIRQTGEEFMEDRNLSGPFT